MPYLVIENFSGGLDSRRFILTASPGTLTIGKNVHLTRGGEIEVRKGFPAYADLTGLSTFGLQAVSTGLLVFGSVTEPIMPSGIAYQRLQHPGGAGMVGVVFSTVYDGLAFVIATFDDGSTQCFYDGTLITDFSNGVTRSDMTDTAGIAAHLKALINADTVYTAADASSVITITAAQGTVFTVATSAENGGLVDDQTAVAATTQVAIAPVAETLGKSVFEINAGTSNPGTNKITSVTVDGVTITGGSVDWANSHAYTAQLLIDSINATTSTPINYTATRAGAVVTITAEVGSGATPNTDVVVVNVAGDVTVTPTGPNDPIAGGVDAIAGRAQTSTVTIGGTFEAGDKFTITLTTGSTATIFGAGRVAGLKPTCAATLQDKIYVGAEGDLYFCDISMPTVWNTGANSGFITMTNQYGGSADITALGVYQNNLAVLSRHSIQIWFMDPEPTLNRQLQVLPNIGTIAAHSLVSYGDSDAFFLADSGIRGLRARDSSNNASVSDIGTPVDNDIIDLLNSLTEPQKARASAMLEPIDARLWMALDNADGFSTIYAFSFFPSSKVSAWSTYEVPWRAVKFDNFENKQYVRAADEVIYKYGGDFGTTYESVSNDTNDSVVEIPYLSASKPGTVKNWHGMDVACEGSWQFDFGTDTSSVTAKENVGTITQSTYDFGNLAVSGEGSHAAFKATHAADGEYARIGMVLLHYNGGHGE